MESPKRKYYVRIVINADTSDVAIRCLKEILLDWESRGGISGQASGTVDSGYSVDCEVNVEMTHEKYVEELESYVNLLSMGETSEAKS